MPDTANKKPADDKAYKWIILTVLAALAVWAGLHWWDLGADDRARAERIGRLKAEIHESKMQSLMTCQKAIAATAKYGKGNSPGHVDGQETAGAWIFLWPQGSFHFKNAFGADVPQWARCEVDMNSGRISRLTVTGQEVAGR